MVVVHGSQFIEEIRGVPESVLSSMEPTDEVCVCGEFHARPRILIPSLTPKFLQTEFTLGSNSSTVPYHVPILRSQLTRNLSTLFPAVYEEVEGAFDQLVPARENGWSLILMARIYI